MEALQVLIWYFLVIAFGLLAWPLAFRLLPELPDRGYSLSRALGLLLVGYLFWLLCSLGLLQNTTGGMLFSILVVGGIGLWAYFTRPDRGESLVSWLVEHIKPVLVGEGLFFLAFVGWAVVRAYNPALDHTEKPMELAFLSGIRGSSVFPPLDPWLAGYSISYYYFGYVIMAMLADLAGTSTGVAFNIGVALLFALMLLGSYGLVYNLVTKEQERIGAAVSALLGPLLIGIMGNLEGFLELFKASMIGANFWRWVISSTDIRFWRLVGIKNPSLLDDNFWQWLDIENLTEPLSKVLWPPDQWRFWWWWRASRVIRDQDITGEAIGLQPIDEFPFFSFLLGDMHPHVLALPFVLLALGLAFNVLCQKRRLSWPQLGLLTICFGGLAFLNISDWPIYFFVLISILIVRLIREEKPASWEEWARSVYGLIMPVAGMLAYLPWHISYRSQIGGILPNLVFATRLHQFFVMFGPFLIVIVWFLIDLAIRQCGKLAWRDGILLGIGLLISLAVSTFGMGIVAAKLDPGTRGFLFTNAGLPVPTDTYGNGLWNQIVQAIQIIIHHRLNHSLILLLLIVIIILALAYLLPLLRRPDDPSREHPSFLSPSTSFVVLLILTGALLTLGPEFLYIRDVFSHRLNTIFKFYYAAWVLWGIASAYAIHAVLCRSGYILRFVFGGTVVVFLMAGLVYPSFAIPTRTGGFTRAPGEPSPTLDGIAFIEQLYPSDYMAILWLQQNIEPGSIVLEAVGGSYTIHGRVSASTGLPTVIGWPGHEDQWRGDLFNELAEGREEAVREIYNTPSIIRAQELLAQYRVNYVFVGALERNPFYASPAGIEKFERFLTAVYQDSETTIYRVDDVPMKETP
ncbi:MAG: hypothetical protein JXB07_20495 [Anaerolineae bacterium]|nr:hypothetical protein [Anaerolineae bacterium]